VVLLTGFEPFDGDDINPSWEAASLLDGALLRRHRVVAVRLPTEFHASLAQLKRAIRRHRPSLVLCVGVAGSRTRIAIERVAINLLDARIPDNAGRQPIDLPIVRGGPAAYFARLPVKAMLGALLQAGIPAELSHSAGTYVCNYVFYGLMHALASRPGMRGGFVHVPFAPEQARRRGLTGMPAEKTVRALRILVETALTTRRDVRAVGGEVD
jgi:pyroglutamyl-peptidase